MAHTYQHVYQAMRNSLVDRDRDDLSTINNEQIVETPDGKYSFKEEVPSTAYLIAYSMLYYPGLLTYMDADQPSYIHLHVYIGGETNKQFPFFFNEHIANVAVGLAYYTRLFNVSKHYLTGKTVLIPNFQNPIVRETKRILDQEQLDVRFSKEILVQLLQEGHQYGPTLADDFIANAEFIQEAFVSVGEVAHSEGLN